MSLNRAQVMGNLGADPEQRFLGDGTAVVNLSVATTERWKDKQTGEQKSKTEWHRIVFFGRKAEVIVQYFGKGDQIYVEGEIQTRKWQDNEGNDKYTTEIKGRDFQFCGPTTHGQSGNQGSPEPRQQQQPPAQPGPKQDDFDDDIPF